MGSTKVLDAVTAVVTVLDAALSIPVLDGPQQTEQYMPVYVLVGHDDDPESNEAATYGQEFTSTEEVARIEVGQVLCMVIGHSGGTGMAAVRTSVRDTSIAVDTALQANPTLSGVVGRAVYGSNGVPKQTAGQSGISVRLPFTVDYQVVV